MRPRDTVHYSSEEVWSNCASHNWLALTLKSLYNFHLLVDDTIDVTMPQAVDEIIDVDQFILQKSITKGIVEQNDDVSHARVVKECVEVVRLTPHERVHQHTDEHTVDVPVPPDFGRDR